jgi:hypothetical protein
VNIPSGYATNERTIAEELYIALYTFFFQLHPEYSWNASRASSAFPAVMRIKTVPTRFG